jgi:hypothetical protein
MGNSGAAASSRGNRFHRQRHDVFDLACTHNIVLFLKYPGKKKSGAATMVINSGKQSISVRGALEMNDAGELLFTAAWTGKTPDPADMDAVMALLFLRLELNFTAEDAKSSCPAWMAR